MTGLAAPRVEEIIDGGETPLHAVRVGDPDAPTWLVAHGVGSSARFAVEAFADPLLAAGACLVTYDLRGHGHSAPVRDPAGHALARHVGDLAAVADTCAPTVIAGVSLGGHAAVSYAAEGGPCDVVVACLPAWTGRAVPGEGPHAAVAADVRELGIGALVDRFRADRSMEPWLRDVLVRDWPSHDEASLVAALTALDGGAAPTRRDLELLPVPLGVVGWPDDPGHPIETARAWAAWAPRGAIRRITLGDVGADRAALGQAALAAARDAAG